MKPKLKATKALKGQESVEVLEELLKRHPELAGEAEQIARNILDIVSFEEVAEDVCESLKNIDDIGNLNSRTGSRAHGYVEPPEAACEICNETLKPFPEDLERHLKMRDKPGAVIICQGIVSGLYQVKDQSSGVIEWAGEDYLREEARNTIDLTLAGVLRNGHSDNQMIFNESFLAQVPKWASWIQKKTGQIV